MKNKKYIKRTTANPFAAYSVEFLNSTTFTNKHTGEVLKKPPITFSIYTHMRNAWCLAEENDNKYFESWAAIATAVGLNAEYFTDKQNTKKEIVPNAVKAFLIDTGLVVEGDPYRRCCFKTVLDIEDIKDTWELDNPKMKDFKESHALQQRQYAEHMTEKEAEEEFNESIDEQLNGNIETFSKKAGKEDLSTEADQFLYGKWAGRGKRAEGHYSKVEKNHGKAKANELRKLVIEADKRGERKFRDLYFDIIRPVDTYPDTETKDHSIPEKLPEPEQPPQNDSLILSDDPAQACRQLLRVGRDLDYQLHKNNLKSIGQLGAVCNAIKEGYQVGESWFENTPEVIKGAIHAMFEMKVADQLNDNSILITAHEKLDPTANKIPF